MRYQGILHLLNNLPKNYLAKIHFLEKAVATLIQFQDDIFQREISLTDVEDDVHEVIQRVRKMPQLETATASEHRKSHIRFPSFRFIKSKKQDE